VAGHFAPTPKGPAPPREFDVPLNAAIWDEVVHDSPFETGTAHDEPVLPGAGEDPGRALRRVAGMFATGVTIITTAARGQIHGMTANAFMSVSLVPPLVLISVDRRAKMCGLLHEDARYGVSVLAAGQEALSDRFAGRPGDHAEPRFDLVHDTPLVDGALAHFVARVVKSHWGGDHSLFLGQVEYACYDEDGRPLLFHGGRYEQLGPASG
jgi:flavin reductase (DIM6/NTAB) family NADH-FMN oxidoreductase RutF